MHCWKAFGSPGVIGQAWDGNIPTRRVRVCGGAPTHLGDAAGRGNARAAWEGGSADHA
jgi:hypothetical protein